jgi:hypothetical protein
MGIQFDSLLHRQHSDSQRVDTFGQLDLAIGRRQAERRRPSNPRFFLVLGRQPRPPELGQRSRRDLMETATDGESVVVGRGQLDVNCWFGTQPLTDSLGLTCPTPARRDVTNTNRQPRLSIHTDLRPRN